MLRDNSEQIGTCFIIQYKNKYYLATNYHLLTGRSPWDTKTNDKHWVKGQTPNTLLLWFYKKNGTFSTLVYPLLSKNNTRLFFTPKADSINGIYDLAFLPIKSIPKDAIIDPIRLFIIDSTFKIKEKSKLFFCGFKGDENVSLKYPILDSAYTISDFLYNYNDPYIFCNKTISIQGNSGSPVYCMVNNNYILTGMVSMETNSPISILTKPEFKNIKELKLIYEFVSISTIESQFKIFLSSRLNK